MVAAGGDAWQPGVCPPPRDKLLLSSLSLSYPRAPPHPMAALAIYGSTGARVAVSVRPVAGRSPGMITGALRSG